MDNVFFVGASPSLPYLLKNAVPEYDYKPTDGILTFNPGETTKKIVVPIIGDEKVESDESFTVYLVDPTSPYKRLVETEGIIKNDDTGFSKQSFDIAENSENQTVIGTLHINETIIKYHDFTSSGGIHRIKIPGLKFNITDNVDPDKDGNSAFSLDGDRLIVNDSDDLDYETSPILNISIEASNGELTDEATVTINLTDVDDNQAPTDLKLDNKTINENEPDNSIVGKFSTTDLDSGDTFTYALVAGDGDTDNQAFSINDDQLKINSSPNYENKSSYNIRVQTTDGGGESLEQQFIINVDDINEGPTDLDLGNKNIDENVAPNSVVGEFYTVDPDPGDTFTYALVAGEGDTDNQTFTIDGNQLKINNSPDFETKSTYNIRVQTTDGEGASYQEQLTINVNDIDENEPVRFDFNADGVADILWRHKSLRNGPNRIWLMNDDGTRNQTVKPGNFGSAWDVAGIADFNADGVADILWRHKSLSNGPNKIWLMNDDGTRNQTVNPGNFHSAWDVAGIADFNADGVADILWRHKSHKNGPNRIWLMNDDGTPNQTVNPGDFGSAWDVAGM